MDLTMDMSMASNDPMHQYFMDMNESRSASVMQHVGRTSDENEETKSRMIEQLLAGVGEHGTEDTSGDPNTAATQVAKMRPIIMDTAARWQEFIEHARSCLPYRFRIKIKDSAPIYGIVIAETETDAGFMVKAKLQEIKEELVYVYPNIDMSTVSVYVWPAQISNPFIWIGGIM